MKRSLKGLLNYQVETKDLQHGSARDFLFDEKAWFIRYLKVDFGKMFSSEKVIIPKAFLEKPRYEKRLFPVEIDLSEIGKCPKIKDHLPVSKEYEEQLYNHYDLKPYWLPAYNVPFSVGFYHPRPIRVPSSDVRSLEVNSILRSFKEVEGYNIEAVDGKFGHIEDLIIDDRNWQIEYAVIDTKNWFPWSKQVLISIDMLSVISYQKRIVGINMYADKIKDAPAYNPTDIIDETYEKSLFDFYSQSLVK